MNVDTVSGTALLVDTQRTRLQRVFFQTFAFDSREELFAAVSDVRVGVDTIAQSADARNEVYSGWVYWLLFLRGFLELADRGELADDNTYLDYLIRYYGPRGHDPGIAQELADAEWARSRVEARYALMDAAASVAPGEIWDIEPVVVKVDLVPPEHPLRVFPVGSPQSLAATLVDGWHRLFAAHVWSVASVPGVLVREQEEGAA